MLNPQAALVAGSKKIEVVLLPKGFRFRLHAGGIGSGGEFACAEFVRGDMRLEIHFRDSLGIVRYHIGDQSASHESYMRELGVWDKCRYPGFSDDPMESFGNLAHDLNLAEDFVAGAPATLRSAALKEAADAARQHERLMARYVGDDRVSDGLRKSFREKNYGKVIRLAEKLKFPERLVGSEQSMVKIARKKEGLFSKLSRLLK
jgi:hypothetical protein